MGVYDDSHARPQTLSASCRGRLVIVHAGGLHRGSQATELDKWPCSVNLTSP